MPDALGADLGPSLLQPDLAGWRMAGPGGFRWAGPGLLESWGGSGLFWYAAEVYADFVLAVDWRLAHADDNSGVFLRCPPLGDSPEPAIRDGYEVQIDDRGCDPADGCTGSAPHLTGAIYRLAPARALLSRPIGAWNRFIVTARGDEIAVTLNGAEVSRLTGGTRNRSGHIGLQNHHEGSAVQFRDLRLRPL
jgi:hypothetical protein